MTSVDVGIEKPGPRFPIFNEEDDVAMLFPRPRIKDILSGVILLAAREKEPMPLAKVHSNIHAMKSRESILSGLHFSLTGAVCYSRDIDQAVKDLTDGGFLEIVDDSVFAGKHAPKFGTSLSVFLTKPQIRAIHSLSLRFHERMRRDARDPADRA